MSERVLVYYDEMGIPKGTELWKVIAKKVTNLDEAFYVTCVIKAYSEINSVDDNLDEEDKEFYINIYMSEEDFRDNNCVVVYLTKEELEENRANCEKNIKDSMSNELFDKIFSKSHKLNLTVN